MAADLDHGMPQAHLRPGQAELNLDPLGDDPYDWTDRRDAMHLERLRRNYTNATVQHASSVNDIRGKPSTLPASLKYHLAKFWRHQISVNVPHDSCRDHLALERTFLAYLRTSLALSMIGVSVAQLFRLQHSPTPNTKFGYFVLGKPLACICQGTAIYVLLVGAFRTWRSQNAIVRGKAITGGFEILVIAIGTFVLLTLFLILLVLIDIDKQTPF